MTDSEALRRAQAVRHFNRFYTQLIGALHEHLAKSAFSLTEVRVLHELSRGRAQTASVLGRNLGLDSGYLSRLLTSFERRNLITRPPFPTRTRASHVIALTDNGHAAYAPLDTAAIDEVSALLNGLTALSQEHLIAAMKVIERLLRRKPQHELVSSFGSRAPGECGLARASGRRSGSPRNTAGISRSKGLLARVVADYSTSATIPCARCAGLPIRTAWWSARWCIVGISTTVAGVRLLWVEPDVQRLGIGTQLMNECVRFAARGLHQTHADHGQHARMSRAGYASAPASRLVCTTAERRFGRDLMIERWELEL